MPRSTLVSNPFELMMNPEVVFAAIERSERLGRLKSRICRPLDGPRPIVPAEEVEVMPVEAVAQEVVAQPSFEHSSDAMLDDDDTPEDFGTGI